MTHDELDKQKKNKKVITILGFVVFGMFAFGFALVPLYQVFCSITGFNGSQQGRLADVAYNAKVDKSRTITVQFDATINAKLPIEFHPVTRRLKVHPGQMYTVNYIAKNSSKKAFVTQAVPGITPWQATPHFKKIECFCFTNQTIQAGESKEMPLRFFVSPDLSKDIKTLTLSYSIMNTGLEATQKIAKNSLLEAK